MVVTLGQQYNIGEKPTVILYTYINRHAGTPDKQLCAKFESGLCIFFFVYYIVDNDVLYSHIVMAPPAIFCDNVEKLK